MSLVTVGYENQYAPEKSDDPINRSAKRDVVQTSVIQRGAVGGRSKAVTATPRRYIAFL